MKTTSIIMAALVTVTVLFSGCKKKDVEATYIQKVKLTKWPMAASDGTTWDLNSGPDVYIKIIENNSERWVAGTVYDDAVSGNSILEFNVTPVVNMNDADGKVNIEVWDRDGGIDADDMIGNLEVQPFEDKSTDDGVVTKVYNGSNVGADITFEFKY